jgi:hypothetical protein
MEERVTYSADPNDSPHAKYLVGHPSRHGQLPSFEIWNSEGRVTRYGYRDLATAKRRFHKLRRLSGWKSATDWHVRVMFGPKDEADRIPLS